MSGFTLPPLAPDFSLMTRERLEDYAAEVDYRLRAFAEAQDDFTDDLLVFMKAVRSAVPPSALRYDYPFTPQMATLVTCLNGSPRHRESLYQALYANRPAADGPDIKIVDVVVARARPLLTFIDCPIQTVWGIGYALPRSARLRALVAAHKANPAAPVLELLDREHLPEHLKGEQS